MKSPDTRNTPAKAGHYVWHVEGKPISIHLSPAAAASLRQIAKPGTDVTSEVVVDEGRPVERGGILMGRVQASEEYTIVSVEAVERVACEHRRSASWTLSHFDKLGMYRHLRRSSGSELQPVGIFRSHSRPGLFLDDYDLNLMRTFFSSASSVALLVTAEADARAGFFFWEGSDLQRSQPYKSFALSDVRGPQTVPRPVPAEHRQLGNFDWRWAVAPLALGLAAIVPGYFSSLDRSNSITEDQQTTRVASESRAPRAEQRTVPVEEPSLRTARVPRDIDARSSGRATSPARTVMPSASRLRQRVIKPVVTATVRPADQSAVRRVLGRLPGLKKLRKENANFSEARPVYRVTPSQSDTAGTSIKVRVDETGAVRSAWLTGGAGDPTAAAAALNATKRWRFSPAKRDGKPVESSLVIQFSPVVRTSAAIDPPVPAPRRTL